MVMNDRDLVGMELKIRHIRVSKLFLAVATLRQKEVCNLSRSTRN